MDRLRIEQTKSTPMIDFDSDTGILKIVGESYPENAAKFYTPVVEWLKEYLNKGGVVKALVEFEIIYFNSSSSKVFMTIFNLLEESAANGKQVSVVWRCDHENQTAIECGEEFKEDTAHLPFAIEIIDAETRRD